MKKIGKYLLYAIIFLSIPFILLLGTDTGKKIGYFYLSDTLSEKSHLDIKVLSLNLYSYPQVSASLLIEGQYTLSTKGSIEQFKSLDLNYTITSNCIETHYCSLNDTIDINGTVIGKFRNLAIQGEGSILGGTIAYEGKRVQRDFKDVTVNIVDINSTKFLQLLGEKALFHGKSSAKIHFENIGKNGKKGTIVYTVKDHDFSGIPIEFHANVAINNDMQTFFMHLITPTARLDICNGEYNRKNKYGSAVFVLDVKELKDMKPLLKVKATGPFFAYGEMIYDKKIKLQAITKSFGGIIDIVYEKKKFLFYLHEVPFNSLMNRLTYAPLLDAKMQGNITYDVRQKEMQTKVKLNEVTFLQKELVRFVDEKFEYKLNQELFPDSSFEATYSKEKILSSTITIANKKNHFIFKDTKLNANEKSIDTHIDFIVDNHAIHGHLYGRNDGYENHTLDTYLKFDGVIENHYKTNLSGSISDKWINMNYALSAERLPSHICTIVDDVNLTGHVYGPLKRLFIQGEGTALNGSVSFNGVKEHDTFKHVKVQMNDIHGKKLSTLLDTTIIPHGKATLNLELQHYNQEHAKGTLDYALNNATFKTLPLSFKSQTEFEDENYNFNGTVHIDNATIDITKGHHDSNSKKTRAFYKLNVQELATLEPLIGYEYKGLFNALGTIEHNGTYHIHGLSKSLNGMTEFDYKQDILNIDLNHVSFKRIMSLFPYPEMLDADTTGNVNYNFSTEKLLLNATLKNTKFLHTDVIDKIYEKSGVNMLEESFETSTLSIEHQNNVLLGNLVMDSERSHFSLTNTLLNTKEKTINAYFDFKMQGKEFSGKVYGSLDDPKVNLNMQKLIEHEMDKQLDSMIGKGNREMMESMPMGGMAKDVGTGMGGAFMGIFF